MPPSKKGSRPASVGGKPSVRGGLSPQQHTALPFTSPRWWLRCHFWDEEGSGGSGGSSISSFVPFGPIKDAPPCGHTCE